MRGSCYINYCLNKMSIHLKAILNIYFFATQIVNIENTTGFKTKSYVTYSSIAGLFD